MRDCRFGVPQVTILILILIIESDARLTGVQLKGGAKLLTVIGLNTKHADCRIIFMLYSIRL